MARLDAINKHTVQGCCKLMIKLLNQFIRLQILGSKHTLKAHNYNLCCVPNADRE